MKLEIISSTSKEVVTNFTALKNMVEEEIKKRGVAVTSENIPDAKKAMANLNKVKQEVLGQYKEVIAEISIPITALKKEMDILKGVFDDGRSVIALEVSKYEEGKLIIAKKEIEAYASKICEEKNISVGAITTQDLIKLGAITTSGNLAKATREIIDMRIITVENEVLKAKAIEEEKQRERDIIAEEKAQIKIEEMRKSLGVVAQAEEEDGLDNLFGVKEQIAESGGNSSSLSPSITVVTDNKMLKSLGSMCHDIVVKSFYSTLQVSLTWSVENNLKSFESCLVVKMTKDKEVAVISLYDNREDNHSLYKAIIDTMQDSNLFDMLLSVDGVNIIPTP